jgi:CRISPR-associated protein Cas2
VEILVTYDVNTLTKDGRARLRRVAKICEGHGQRVQFSVFECSVNETQLETLRHRLVKAISQDEDNLRLYFLRGKRDDNIESYGIDKAIDFHQPLIL